MGLQREIYVRLDEDTAQFLEMAKGSHRADAVSQFINSLLRQERFRQGFPPYFKQAEPLRPCSNPQEKRMLLRSGLLPPLSRLPRSQKKKSLLEWLMGARV
jgi:hypothetical protein